MPKRKTLYSVHPGVEMVQKWIADLKAKTGRSLDEWMKVIETDAPASEAERRAWLKATHNFGSNTASWLAQRSLGIATWDDSPEVYLKQAEVYVQEMFAGKKAGLKPIYDTILKMCLGLAKDVKACPCKTIVPLYRHHVFAQIKPTTNTRIDMGFALKDTKVKGRLLDTGGFAKKDRITHRIPITSMAEIDDEVKRWLKVAYDMDA
ncbi:MAG: DUF4287 domain-containing protein [Planctomycetes bacterium]|nr:DUF4287 domain-containing protein [Planctomycetota bacterium]